MDSDELLALLAAVGHPQRLRVIAELAHGRQYVSELARRLGMSRPLLYVHLGRLEKVGLVVGTLNASTEGKALKYFELVPFELNLNTPSILAVLEADGASAESSASPEDAQNAARPPDRAPNDEPGPGPTLDGPGPMLDGPGPMLDGPGPMLDGCLADHASPRQSHDA